MKYLFGLSIVFIFIGCKKKIENAPITVTENFTNVVILGNSITYAPRDTTLGWLNSWGMAASAQNKDYVHLLTDSLIKVNANCRVQATNIAAFERDFVNYDFDANLKTYRDSKPDLLILRIGENVPAVFDSLAFVGRYQALITYMKTNNPDLKVLSVGSFFLQRDKINALMSHFTPYVSLTPIGNDITNYAFNLPGVAYGVQLHPGDKGMQAIADTIWRRINAF